MILKKIIFLTDHIFTENLLCNIISASSDYINLTNAFYQSGIELTYASFNYYNKYQEGFSEYIQWNKEISSFEKKNGMLIPDLIWVNTKNGIEYVYDCLEISHTMIPSKHSAQYLCDNYSLYLATKKYQKPALLLDNFLSEVKSQSLIGDKIIIKPIRGKDERGIDVMSKNSFISTVEDIKTYNLDYLFLVQDDINIDLKEDESSVENLAISLNVINGKIMLGTIASGDHPQAILREDIPMEVFEMHENILKDLPFLKNDPFLMQFGYSKIENRWFFIDVDYINISEVHLGVNYTMNKYKLLSDFFKEKL